MPTIQRNREMPVAPGDLLRITDPEQPSMSLNCMVLAVGDGWFDIVNREDGDGSSRQRIVMRAPVSHTSSEIGYRIPLTNWKNSP